MPITRLKRKSDGAQIEEPTVTGRCFSNLTNFKSPKSRKKVAKVENSANKLTRNINSASTSECDRASIVAAKVLEDSSTQSNEIVISQLPEKIIPNSNGDFVNMVRSIKSVLELNFKNVSERLQLESIPPYLYDLKAYQRKFAKNAQVQFASNESVYLAKNLLTEDRHGQFIHYVRNSMCGRSEFPGAMIARGVLELILKTSSGDSQNTCVPTQQALVELYSLFTGIIITFPSHPYRDSYLQLFHSSFKVSGVRANKSNHGVFQSMLDLLTDLIHHNQEHIERKETGDHEKLNNFYFWDAQNEEKSSFVNFLREEKLERVFLVLDLLVRTLENDFAMFIIRSSSRLRSAINNKMTCPLVCSVLWQSHESVIVINSTIKSIISAYVNMIALQYPREKVQILARLLNLVSQVVNLNEYPDQTFEFPIYKNISTDLVNEIQRTVENSVYYSVGLIISVAEHARSPLTQMLLTGQIIQKIHNVTKPTSLQVPFELIKKSEELKFEDISETVVVRHEKFPPFDPKITTNRREITRNEYLKLLRIYAGAVNSYYQIGRVVQEYLKCKTQGIVEQRVTIFSDPVTFDFSTFEEKLKEIDLNEKVELSQVDLSFKKLVHIKLTKETSEFYREEIKHFLLLKKLIKKCPEKFGRKFDDWAELVKDESV